MLDVRAAKVVAGLEPECTNAFLIAFAECAADANYDSAEAVRRCLAGETASNGGAPCVRGGGGHGAEAKGGPDGMGAGAKGEIESDAKALNDFKADQGDGNDRGKSRGGTRGGKPQTQTTDVGLGGFSGAPAAMNLDSEVERCDGSVELTQSMLGGLIRKPKLAEKLLGKPPFRFLYDIVMEVKNVSGFANGLFTEEESSSANVTSKEQKINFLDKIIMLVGVQLNTIVEARPAKIVAGLDAHLTNTFLQLLAVCATHAANSDASVPTVLDKLGLPGGEIVPSTSPAGAGAGAGAAMAPPQSMAPSTDSDAKGEMRSPQPQPAKAAEPERREIGAADAKSADNGDAGGEVKRTGRPTTARRRPPKVKDGAKEVEKGASPVKKASGIMVDGADDDDDEDIPVEIDTRLADDVKADGKGAGAPAESKIVRDILGRQAEQEAARAAPDAGEATAEQKSDMEGSSKGGIRIGRLRKTGTGRGSSDKDAKQSTPGAPAALGEGDLDKLRNSIQILVQHTGPLGSVLDYLQEDVGLMTQELRKWEEESRKHEARLAVEQDKTNEELQPLQAELTELDVQISEKIAQISSTKANVARNEERLLQLMKMMSGNQ